MPKLSERQIPGPDPTIRPDGLEVSCLACGERGRFIILAGSEPRAVEAAAVPAERQGVACGRCGSRNALLLQPAQMCW